MKKWICIGLFLIGTCSVQAQDLVSDFLAKTKENKVFKILLSSVPVRAFFMRFLITFLPPLGLLSVSPLSVLSVLSVLSEI